MDPILYRPLDVLDERVRRASDHQRQQPRPRPPRPEGPHFYWWPGGRHRA